MTPIQPKWQARLGRSVYFLIAVLFHLILFLMVATLIVFEARVQESTSTFGRVSVQVPPPPPTPPSPAGGQAANQLEPAIEMAPPPAMPSVVSSVNPSSFAITSVKADIPNLPASMTAPVGTGLTGANVPGTALGAGSSPFGSESKGGAAQLQGFLYDLKQTANRKPTGMTPSAFHEKLVQFVKAQWDPALLAPYYKSPKSLNTSAIFIPTLNAKDGPKAFGVENEVQPNAYLIWYKGTVTPGQAGTYHFVGIGDDILVVRVNGQTVLDGSLFPVAPDLQKTEAKYPMMNFHPSCPADSALYVGAPFRIAPGDSVEIDVLIGEQPGGYSNYFLFIQREEGNYNRQANGTPLLPVFQLGSDSIHPEGKPLSFPPFASTAEPWSGPQK